MFAGALVSAAFGQGTILFQNRDLAYDINAPVYIGQPILIDGADPLWRAALLGGPLDSVAAFPGHSLGTLAMLASPDTGATWVGFGTGSDAGYINIGSDTKRIVPGVNWGEEGLFQMVVWHGNYTTWEEAFNATKDDPNGVIGASFPVLVRLPSGPDVSDNLQARLFYLDSFSIEIPEPSGVVYLLLGAIGWFLVRGRNSTAS